MSTCGDAGIDFNADLGVGCEVEPLLRVREEILICSGDS